MSTFSANPSPPEGSWRPRSGLGRLQPLHISLPAAAPVLFNATALTVGVLLLFVPLDLFRALGAATTAVEVPVVIFQSCAELLRRRYAALDAIPDRVLTATDSAMKRVEGVADHALAKYLAAYIVGADSRVSLPDEGARLVWSKVCLPVAVQTIDLQRGRALTTNYDLDITMQQAHEEASFGWLAVFRRNGRFDVPLTDASDWQTLVRPTLVINSRGFELDSVVQMAVTGKVDLLYPIPGGWLDEGSAYLSDLASAEWLHVKRLDIGGQPVKYPLIRRPSAGDIEHVIGPTLSLAPPDYKELADVTFMLGYVEPPVGTALESLANAGNVEVSTETEYKVWVEDRRGHELPRYAIPFWEPATVRYIHFELAKELQTTVQLDPASVNCAYRLRQEWTRRDPVDQRLAWQSLGLPTPFLPGHGVTFHWRAVREDRSD
jgi:hypothetical protein